jgi:MAF protein
MVLASGSPRRQELIALLGLPVEILPAQIDESSHLGEAPTDYVARLSVEKARIAAAQVSERAWIVGADTVVVDGETLIGKPETAEEAAGILASLRGRTHQAVTGLTLLNTGTGVSRTEIVFSPVKMRQYSDEEILAYIASGDPFDKAGAYAIQDFVFQPVIEFAHCFANVMGLPLCHLSRMLAETGWGGAGSVPAACQKALAYSCPVYKAILSC